MCAARMGKLSLLLSNTVAVISQSSYGVNKQVRINLRNYYLPKQFERFNSICLRFGRKIPNSSHFELSRSICSNGRSAIITASFRAPNIASS